MQSREKILAAILGGVLLLVGGYFGVKKLAETIQGRQTQLSVLQNDVFAKDVELRGRNDALDHLDRLRERSLPADKGVAQHVYNDWLVNLAKRSDVGLKDVQIVNVDPFEKQGYREFNFKLIAKGTLEQITRFLYRFYRADHLHKITSLKMTPVKARADEPSHDLDLVANIQALALDDAKKSTLSKGVSPCLACGGFDKMPQQLSDMLADPTLWSGPNSTRRLAAALADPVYYSYRQSIVDRNALGHNRAPELSALRDRTVARTHPLRVSLRGSDADSKTALTYKVYGLPGATISAGQLNWTPPKDAELTTHEVSVTATDSGVPPREVSRTFKVKVEDAPPVIETIAGKTVAPGDSLQFTVDARDPDGESAVIVYELSGNPLGAKLSPEGVFSWVCPATAGADSHSLKIKATDEAGLSAERTFRVTIRPSTDINDAQFAFLEAVLQGRQRREAWIKVRTKDQLLKVKEGESHRVGKVEFKVESIDLENHEIEVSIGGKSHRLTLGDTLVERESP